MLSLGFVFTIWPMAWVTASVAIIIGIWALSVIESSPEPLAGKLVAWWCIIVGGMENVLLFWSLDWWETLQRILW